MPPTSSISRARTVAKIGRPMKKLTIGARLRPVGVRRADHVFRSRRARRPRSACRMARRPVSTTRSGFGLDR